MKIKISILFTSIFVIYCLSGCATTKSKIAFFEEQRTKQEAIVYVYRLKSIVGAAAWWNVYLDGKVVGLLTQGAYIPLHVSPGQHSIAVGDIGSPVIIPWYVSSELSKSEVGADRFTVKENETYYIRCKGFEVSFLKKEEAMPELSLMKYDPGM